MLHDATGRKERVHRSRERRQALAELLAFHLVRRRELRIPFESQGLAGGLGGLELCTQAKHLLAGQELQPEGPAHAAWRERLVGRHVYLLGAGRRHAPS